MSGGPGIGGDRWRVQIRYAVPADREFITFILADGSSVSNGQRLDWFDRETTTTWVAVDSGRVVGQIMIDDAPIEGRPDIGDKRRLVRLFGLFVDPKERRRGIASALMRVAEQAAAGSDGILLMVEKELSIVRLMYERRGYVKYAELDVECVTDDGRTVVTHNDAMWQQLPKPAA